MNNIDAREIQVNLDFLGSGPYKATLLSDHPDQDAAFNRKAERVTSEDQWTIQMQSAGGFVARISPK